MNYSLFDNFWLVLIAVNCLNTLIFSFTARAALKEKPELYSGYRQITRGTLVFFNVPFLIMGVGIIAGYAPTMNHYFRLQAEN